MFRGETSADPSYDIMSFPLRSPTREKYELTSALNCWGRRKPLIAFVAIALIIPLYSFADKKMSAKNETQVRGAPAPATRRFTSARTHAQQDSNSPRGHPDCCVSTRVRMCMQVGDASAVDRIKADAASCVGENYELTQQRLVAPSFCFLR